MNQGHGPGDLANQTTELPEDVLTDLRDIARPSAPGTDALEAFLTALDEAAVAYRAAETIRNASRAANLRGDLAAVEAAFRRFEARVNDLGGPLRQLLLGDSGIRERSDLQAALDVIADRIAAARSQAAEVPVAGRHSRQTARHYLAVDLARAIRRHLDIEPVIQGGMLFDTLLKTLLEGVSADRDETSIQDLKRGALMADEGRQEPGPGDD